MPISPAIRDLLLGGGLGAAGGALLAPEGQRTKHALIGAAAGAPLAMGAGAAARNLWPGTFGANPGSAPTHNLLNPANTPVGQQPSQTMSSPAGRSVEVPGQLAGQDIPDYLKLKDIENAKNISWKDHPELMDAVVSGDMRARLGNPGVDNRGVDTPGPISGTLQSLGSGWPGADLVQRGMAAATSPIFGRGVENNPYDRSLMDSSVAVKQHPYAHLIGNLAPLALTGGSSAAAPEGAGFLSRWMPNLARAVATRSPGVLAESTGVGQGAKYLAGRLGMAVGKKLPRLGFLGQAGTLGTLSPLVPSGRTAESEMQADSLLSPKE